MSATETRVPASLDLRALHERCTGTIAARQAILRCLPGKDLNDGGVDLHLTVDGGKGLMSFRVMVPAHQVDQLIAMIEVAGQEGRPDA